LDAGKITSLDDLVPVCSNCHRMLHRNYSEIKWQKIKEMMSQRFVEKMRR
jgi:predicted HNH restriction endonuclease